MGYKKRLTVAALALALAPAAWATDGYFSHGYGMTAKGMGGAATAMTKDTFGGANNPASMVWVGDRLDVGLDWFSPKRAVERTNSTGGGAGMNGSAQSGSNDFWIPEFGYNRMLDANKSLGVTVYGNGGMNTDYPGGQIAGGTACGPGGAGFAPATVSAPLNLLCGGGRLGIDLMQLIIAPTFAIKINESNSLGISPLIGYQRFKANGLEGFYGYTPSPAGWPGNNSLTGRGYDTSHGFGLRFGWLGKVSDSVSFGAAYATKMKMSKFDMYKDLFAERGRFDMPENFNFGISVKAASSVTLAADYQRINYSGVKSVSNPSTNGGLTTAGTLGCDNCRGFGWDSVNVIKLGIEYQYNPNLILRAGYNHTDNPIQARDVTFNIIAPGVVQNHATLGFTYNVSKDSEVTMAYMHAFKNSVSGASLFNNWLGDSAQEKIQMYQNSLGIAYSVKFQ
jgi:long-chain fatty acid transport protein